MIISIIPVMQDMLVVFNLIFSQFILAPTYYYKAIVRDLWRLLFPQLLLYCVHNQHTVCLLTLLCLVSKVGSLT